MVFDEKWFKKYQRILLLIINTSLGRSFFCINGKRSSVGNNKIIRIDPSVIFWKNEKEYIAEFRSNNKFARRLYYGLKPLWHLIHFWDMNFAKKVSYSLNLGFDTLTQYPDASYVDGRVGRGGVDESFASIKGGVGNSSSVQPANLTAVGLTASGVLNQFTNLFRYITQFNTASLLSNCTVTAVVHSMWGFGAAQIGLGANQMDICSSTPASLTTIATTDYPNLGSTSFGNITTGAWANGSYNDITVNASGIANINKGGVTKFGLRLDWDLQGSFTGVWGFAAETSFPTYGSGQGGTANDPKLLVTFSLPSQGFIT